ncbi:MAG: PHP domain-containing protein [Clostridia bacterium]|nr:PHP domain-containing protein [Clostridia bacterium]
MKADLHIHTVFSDGLYTIPEICDLAAEMGLAGLAFTDHDSIDSLIYYNPQELEKRYGMNFLPGVEIGTHWKGQDIHILGYNIGYNIGWFRDFLSSAQEERQKRSEKIVHLLNQQGYELNDDDVENLAKIPSVGRPHIAEILIEKGYFSRMDQVFDILLNPGKPCYVPRKTFTPFEAIEAILNSGGIPVLAHPGLLKDLSIMDDLIKHNLKGIEVYHPVHPKKTVYSLLKYTVSKDLLATGGSDFHGHGNDELGKCAVAMDVVHKIKNTKINLRESCKT